MKANALSSLGYYEHWVIFYLRRNLTIVEPT